MSGYDDQFVKVTAWWLHDRIAWRDAWYQSDEAWYQGEARGLLAALRDAGFDLYRPNDCLRAVAHPASEPLQRWRIAAPMVDENDVPASAAYWLVPVGGDR